MMKLLLILSGLLAVVLADPEVLDMRREICDIIYGRMDIVHDPRVNVSLVIRDSAGKVVGDSDVRNGYTLTATVTLSGHDMEFVTCVAVFGQAHSRQPLLQHGACLKNTSASSNTGVCEYHVNTDVTNYGKIHIRAGIAAKLNGTEYLLLDKSESVNFKPPRAGETRPPVTTVRPTYRPSTPARPRTTKKAGDNDQNAAVDPHDSKMEAFLAAKYAEMKQKMAEDEDKNSEGNWQKLEENEKREHEDEVQKEMEDYERRLAEEKERRQVMIRDEMRDKEEHDRLEVEEARRATPSPRPPQLVPGAGKEEVDMHEEQQGEETRVVAGWDKRASTAGMARLSLAAGLLALVAAIFM